MARHACTLEGRALLSEDDPDVVALLPDSPDAAIIAVEGSGRRLGAIWWVLREPPLLLDQQGNPLPELAMAVVEDERGKGIGRTMIDTLLDAAHHRFPALTLNVHLLNPAVRLYVRTGFTWPRQDEGGTELRCLVPSTASLIGEAPRTLDHDRSMSTVLIRGFGSTWTRVSGIATVSMRRC